MVASSKSPSASISKMNGLSFSDFKVPLNFVLVSLHHLFNVGHGVFIEIEEGEEQIVQAYKHLVLHLRLEIPDSVFIHSCLPLVVWYNTSRHSDHLWESMEEFSSEALCTKMFQHDMFPDHWTRDRDHTS